MSIVADGKVVRGRFVPASPPAISEKEFRRQVRNLAKMLGWRDYFTWTAVHSPAGFPDLVLVRGERLMFAELKSETGKLTEPQRLWLWALAATGRAEIYVWKPSNLQRIAEALR